MFQPTLRRTDYSSTKDHRIGELCINIVSSNFVELLANVCLYSKGMVTAVTVSMDGISVYAYSLTAFRVVIPTAAFVST